MVSKSVKHAGRMIEIFGAKPFAWREPFVDPAPYDRGVASECPPRGRINLW
jgi:hypothetical protein